MASPCCIAPAPPGALTKQRLQVWKNLRSPVSHLSDSSSLSHGRCTYKSFLIRFSSMLTDRCVLMIVQPRHKRSCFVTSKFVWLLRLIVMRPPLSASLSPSLCLTPSLCVSPPPSPLPLSAVSPLISPVQSAGRHMPSVCGASGDVSCAGVPQSTHNGYAGRAERRAFEAATRSCLVSPR